MKISFKTNEHLGDKGIEVFIDNIQYSLIFKLQFNYNLNKENNQKKLKHFIKVSLKELLLKENTPKEIINNHQDKFFSMYCFLMISKTLFYDEFCIYIRHVILRHVRTKNFDFVDFNLKNLDKRWVYVYEDNKDRLEIKELILKIFRDEVSIEKDISSFYITKSEKFTSEVHVWDIKYKNLYFKDIRFNIPNKDVRDYVYDSEKLQGLIASIKSTLLTKQTFQEVIKGKDIYILLIVIISLIFLTEFRQLIQYFVNELIKTFQTVTVFNLKNIVFNKTDNKTINYILSIHREGNAKKYHYSNELYKRFALVVLEEVEEGYKKQLKQRRLTNERLLKQNTNVWQYQKLTSNNRVHFCTFDFSEFRNLDFLKEVKAYFKWLVLSDRVIPNGFSYLKHFIKFIIEEKEIQNFSSSEITLEDMQKYSLYLIAGEADEISKLKISTRSEIFRDIKTLFDFIINHEISELSGLPPLLKNPCYGIVFKKISEHTVPIQPLPEEVYSMILEYSNQLETAIKNAFIILSATGLRWKELINLNTKCLIQKDNTWYIRAKEYKTLNSKLKQGKSEYREIPIYDENVISSIQEQVQSLYDNDIDSDKIFMRRNKTFTSESYSLISGSSYNEAINKLIVSNNIVTETGELWKYTSHQMRVRIATLLAENGFQAEEISSFLNHTSKQTINKAYAFVRKKRLAELNTSFFKHHFDCIIPKSNIKNLTIDERKSLYVKLFLSYRQMEYGKCIIPMSEGDCGKLQNSNNCASCQYLVTSKEYLVHWKKFFNNQHKRIDELEGFYHQNNIVKEEYSNYIEYKREVFILESYKELLIKLGEDDVE